MPADVPPEWIAWMTVALMTVATLATRLGGFFIMRRLTVTPTLEAFLRALASSVVVAAIAPAAWHGDWAARLAIAVSAGAMALTRKAWLALFCGMAAAAALRQVLVV